MNTKYYDALARRVLLSMNLHMLNGYRPHRSGIRVGVHSFNKKENLAQLTLFGSSMTGTPQDDITIDDINTELRILEKKKILIADKQRKVIGNPFRNNYLINDKSIMFTPYYSGENDRLNSRARNIYHNYIPKEEFRNVEKHAEKNKKQFDGRHKVEHLGEYKNPNTFEKFVKVKIGDIISA